MEKGKKDPEKPHAVPPLWDSMEYSDEPQKLFQHWLCSRGNQRRQSEKLWGEGRGHRLRLERRKSLGKRGERGKKKREARSGEEREEAHS